MLYPKDTHATTPLADCLQSLLPGEEDTLCLPAPTGFGWERLKLQLAPFEAAYQRARAQFEESLELDSWAAELPGPWSLELSHAISSRAGKQGGRHARPLLPLVELCSAAATPRERRRPSVKTQYKDWSLEKLADRVRWSHVHRARGWSESDAEAQREWCDARSLGIGFWISKCFRGDRVGVPQVLRAMLGRAVQSRLELLAMIVEAKRLGYYGATFSAPEFEHATGISSRSFWRAVAWLEERGWITVMRCYKVGHGRPVGLDRNWYGPGPRLRKEFAGVLWGHDLEKDADMHRRMRSILGARRRRRRRRAARACGWLTRIEWAQCVALHAAQRRTSEAGEERRVNEVWSSGAGAGLVKALRAGKLPENWSERLRMAAEAVATPWAGPRDQEPLSRAVEEAAEALLRARAEKWAKVWDADVGAAYRRSQALSGTLEPVDPREEFAAAPPASSFWGALPHDTSTWDPSFAGEEPHSGRKVLFSGPVSGPRPTPCSASGQDEVRPTAPSSASPFLGREASGGAQLDGCRSGASLRKHQDRRLGELAAELLSLIRRE